MNKLVSFWGGGVTWCETVCIKSMLAQGYDLTVYTYDDREMSEIRRLVKVADAADIIGKDHAMTRFQNARIFQTFSDYFRLELQRQQKGAWVDLDCLFLRRFDFSADYIFGSTLDGKLNNAVLKLPDESTMLKDYMASILADPLRIPWATWRRRFWRTVDIARGNSEPDISYQLSIGPRALTYFAKKHGKMPLAQPNSVFYPIPAGRAGLCVAEDPAEANTFMDTESTILHLWRGWLNDNGALNQLPPKTSVVGVLMSDMGAYE